MPRFRKDTHRCLSQGRKHVIGRVAMKLISRIRAVEKAKYTGGLGNVAF